MKNLPCDVCGEGCEAENFEAWFQKQLTHWKANHQDEMQKMQETFSKEDGEKWMADHKAKFEALS